MNSPIDDNFIKEFAARTLTIHCASILLRQNKTDGGNVYKGPGLITLAPEDGTFSIQVYSETHDPERNIIEIFDRAASYEPGVLFPPETFYTLEAISMKGHTWTSPRCRVRIESGAVGTMIFTDCPTLYTIATRPGRRTKESLRLICFSDLDIPLNRQIVERISSGDTLLTQSARFARAEFEHGNVQFEFEKLETPKGATELICRSNNPLPPVFSARIQEALRFVTFSRVAWAITQHALGDTIKIAIIATGSNPVGTLPVPVPAISEPESYWRLFTCYLDHVCKNPDPVKYHQLTAILSRLVSMQNIPVETLALTLGISVEGLLNSEFPTLAEPHTTLLKALEGLKTLLRRVKCDFPGLRLRLTGSLDAMRGRRPKDALVLLRDRGVITQPQFRAWETLRNSAAHAELIDDDHLQERLQQCFAVYEVVLILTFMAIGYKGKYHQTSLAGWPVGEFATSLESVVS